MPALKAASVLLAFSLRKTCVYDKFTTVF